MNVKMLTHLERHKLRVNIMWSCQLAASAKPGCVMGTVTARITQMRTTVRLWCASYLTTCVLPTTPYVCLLRSCVMALTIVRMALTRSFVVKNTTMFSVPDGFVIHLSYWYSKQCCSPVSANPIISISSLQTCVHWIMVVVVTTAASFLGRASCVLVPLAWSWEQTTRPARSRASAPNISSVARSASRKNPVSSVPATKVGSWRLTWRAAKVLVRKKESLLQTEECIFGFKLRVKYLGQKKHYNSHSI